jgi:hypothetical protein
VYNEVRIAVIKMNKVIKISIILVIILTIQLNFCGKVFAEDPAEQSGYSAADKKSSGSSTSSKVLEGDLNDFNPNPGGTDSSFDEKLGVILGIIRSLGIIVSIGTLMVIGIRTMVASASEKSVYKQALPGYILGAFMVFAITCIPELIYNLMKAT